MTAVLTLPEATDPTHLAAELGPLPTAMDWTHLLTPIQLKHFLHPTDDNNDGEDGDDKLPPWH
jgi:hypothetical protein